MCFKRSYFSVCCFLGTLMEEKTLAGENLAYHFIPKICISYGNTVVRGLAHWNLEYSHAGILKYPKKHGFWRHSKFNSQNFGKRGSILSFSVSLYIPWNPIISHYILLYCVCSPIVFFYDIPRIFHDVSHKSTMLSCWSRFSIPASSQPMLPDAEDCGTRGTRGAQIGISDKVFWMLRPRPWETGETGNWTKENGDFLGFYSWFMIWIAEPVEPLQWLRRSELASQNWDFRNHPM